MAIEKTTNISFKIVGLIASVVTILACFVAAVTWVSMSMADNAVSISVLKDTQNRHEALISKNSQIIQQHAQLLAILDQHSRSLRTLTNFMTQGGRFTEQDGKELDAEIQIVKGQLQNYEVLKTELSWIKKSILDLEVDLRRRFDRISQQLEKIIPQRKDK